MTPKNIQPLRELYRKINIVTNIRYSSSRRLQSHQQLSQWVVTFLSVILIIVPLMQALKVEVKYSVQFLNTVQVVLAVLVLTYSLLLNIENYGARSEKMHSCGMELSYLSREILPYINEDHNNSLYESFSKKYQHILEKYENHQQIDYKINSLGKDWKYYYKSLNRFCFSWILISI